jgi:hypothetical protein
MLFNLAQLELVKCISYGPRSLKLTDVTSLMQDEETRAIAETRAVAAAQLEAAGGTVVQKCIA